MRQGHDLDLLYLVAHFAGYNNLLGTMPPDLHQMATTISATTLRVSRKDVVEQRMLDDLGRVITFKFVIRGGRRWPTHSCG